MAKSKNKVICRHGKRSALRSPLSLDSSELFIDGESGALTLNVVILNTSTEKEPVYVESAGLVIRCFDHSGNLIVSGGREIISKTLKFPEEGLAPEAAVGIKTKIDLSGDLVADFDVYIGCIRTTSLVVTDFVRADFFDEPEEPIPLSAGMSDEEIYDVCDKISESAVCYPDELSSLVWRCTCTEISDSAECPKCGAVKSELFTFFSSLVRPARRSGTPDKRKRLQLLIVILATLFFIAALVLAVLLVFFLSDGRYGGRPSGPDFGDGTQSEETEETPEEKSARLDSLLEANSYAEAMALAKEESHLSDRVPEIAEAAVNYYTEKDDYDSARLFAKDTKAPADIENTVLLAGYAHYINNKIFDKALEYARLLGDSEKINTVILNNIDHLVSEKAFSEAIDLAVESGLDAKKEEVVLSAVSALSAERNYSSALEFALLSNKENVPKDLAREASYYYLEEKDIASAISYAKYVGDDSLMKDIGAKMTDAQLKKELGAFFKYLTFERKQSVYATSVSLDKRFAVINKAGKVIYGANETYMPPAGTKAVSVKTSAHHTVVLLSDGSVVAFGDNTFGQCDVSLWKNVVAIDVGEYHTVALLEDGSVRACGSRAFGQCSVSDLKDIIMISAGDYHTLALRSNGSVTAVGNNSSSQCNVSEWKDVVMISAGSLNSVAVTSSGSALAVGSSSLGRCNVSEWSGVLMISAGSSHTVAILDDGSSVACGGSIGGGSYGALVFGEKIICIEAGNNCTVAITESGKLVFTGDGLPSVDKVKDEKVNANYFFTNMQ